MRYTLLLCLVAFINCKESPKSQKESSPTSEIPTQKENIEFEVTPVEHATAVIRWDGLTLYVDPVGGEEAFSAFPPPDLILITDIHGDHFNVETLDGLQTSQAKIIVPQAVADQLPEQYAPQVDVLNNGDTKERFGMLVEAIPMYNLREVAKNFHQKGRGNGYVISKGGMRVYFSGDTEDIPEMRALEHIDKAFICMNLPYTMTVENAAEAVLDFKPKTVYPYHYRGRPDVSDVGKFAELVASRDPEIEVVQLDWYPNAAY